MVLPQTRIEQTMNKNNSSTNLLRNDQSLITSADQMVSLQQVSQMLSEKRPTNMNSLNQTDEVTHTKKRKVGKKKQNAVAAVA